MVKPVKWPPDVICGNLACCISNGCARINMQVPLFKIAINHNIYINNTVIQSSLCIEFKVILRKLNANSFDWSQFLGKCCLSLFPGFSDQYDGRVVAT